MRLNDHHQLLPANQGILQDGPTATPRPVAGANAAPPSGPMWRPWESTPLTDKSYMVRELNHQVASKVPCGGYEVGVQVQGHRLWQTFKRIARRFRHHVPRCCGQGEGESRPSR